MNRMVRNAKIFPNQVQSGITLTQRKTGNEGYSFALSKIGKRYSLDSIHNAQEQLALSLNTHREQLQYIHQEHSDIVEIIQDKQQYIKGDAMITQSKNLVLCISVADCVGITLYDPITEVIAGIHSGWRGTYKNIVKKTIETMKSEFEVEARNMFAYISPSASQNNYEVQEDVSSLFNKRYVQTIGTKTFLDVGGNVVDQLIETGIQLKNIERDHTCTITDEHFHSYRRDGEMFGLNVVFIHQFSQKTM